MTNENDAVEVILNRCKIEPHYDGSNILCKNTCIDEYIQTSHASCHNSIIQCIENKIEQIVAIMANTQCYLTSNDAPSHH